MQLLFFGHWGAAFATSEDDGLTAFGDGELALEFSSGGEERGNARGDVVVHTVGIEESHLLLDSAEDAGVARMEADDEVAEVVVLLHEGTLLFKIHVSRRADNGAGLVAIREGTRNEGACIENEVSLLEETAAADGDEVRVAGAGTDDFNKPLILGGKTAEHQLTAGGGRI